jgi:hypothetical protein
MIKWFLSTVMVAALVAGVMILYLSPELRSKSLEWVKSRNQVVEKRLKGMGSTLPGIPSKDQFVQAKEVLLNKNAGAKTTPAQVEKPAAKAAKSAKAPAADKISDRDRAQLEQVLEKANK